MNMEFIHSNGISSTQYIIVHDVKEGKSLHIGCMGGLYVSA